HLVPLLLGDGCEHLMQGAEGFPLKTDALGGRGKPQRGRQGLDADLAEPRGLEGGLQDPGRAEAERAGLSGLGRRQLCPVTDDRYRDREELVAVGRGEGHRGQPAALPQHPAHASEGQVPVGEVDEPEPGDHRVECALSQGAEGLAVESLGPCAPPGHLEHPVGSLAQPRLRSRSPPIPRLGTVLPLLAGRRLVLGRIETHRRASSCWDLAEPSRVVGFEAGFAGAYSPLLIAAMVPLSLVALADRTELVFRATPPPQTALRSQAHTRRYAPSAISESLGRHSAALQTATVTQLSKLRFARAPASGSPMVLVRCHREQDDGEGRTSCWAFGMTGLTRGARRSLCPRQARPRLFN